MTDSVSLLAHRLAAGGTLFIGWCATAEATNAEGLVHAGFDAVVLDMQHGSWDVATAIQGIGAVALAGGPALVRIPVGDFATAARMLDAGAAGIVAPMINSAADAELFVSFTKFPPVGARSWGPARALSISGLDSAAYLRDANALQLAIAMIETREALALIDDILAVPGIDGVLVGPSDLSIGLSNGARLDPHGDDVVAAMGHIAARCAAHGKLATAFCADGVIARRVAAMGFRVCAVGTDQTLLRLGAESQVAAARS